MYVHMACKNFTHLRRVSRNNSISGSTSFKKNKMFTLITGRPLVQIYTDRFGRNEVFCFYLDKKWNKISTVDMTVQDILLNILGIDFSEGSGFLWSFSTACKSILSSKSSLACCGANCIFGRALFGAIHKPRGQFFWPFLTFHLPPSWTISLNTTNVVIWTFG